MLRDAVIDSCHWHTGEKSGKTRVVRELKSEEFPSK